MGMQSLIVELSNSPFKNYNLPGKRQVSLILKTPKFNLGLLNAEKLYRIINKKKDMRNCGPILSKCIHLKEKTVFDD